MKDFIQKWLGITELQVTIIETASLQSAQLAELRGLKGQLIASNMGMARIIAKLDPMYGVAYDDPERKAASDKLSQEIIKKLIAEHVISNRMQTGDPE